MRFTKTIATALALTVGALSFASSADARTRYWRHGGYHAYKPHHGFHHHGFRHHRFHHDDDDFNGGAVLFGFAAGAFLGSALSRPCYGCGYSYAPAPVYTAPVVVYQPWTPAWFSYCRGKYRSFNASTGYYLGYDGGYHFCR